MMLWGWRPSLWSVVRSSGERTDRPSCAAMAGVRRRRRAFADRNSDLAFPYGVLMSSCSRRTAGAFFILPQWLLIDGRDVGRFAASFDRLPERRKAAKLCCAGPVLAATRPALHPKPQAPGRLPGCVTHPSSHCQVTHISCRRLLAGAMPRPEICSEA